MTQPAKQRVMYISSRTDAADFKNRCTDLSDDIEIATLKAFGTKPVADTFGSIEKIMKLGALEWTIFHLPSVNDTIGATVFFEELKKLIKNDAVKRAHTAIIDEDELYKADVRKILANAGVQVVTDPRDLGVPFNRMLTPEEYEFRLAGEQNEAFAGLEHDYSTDGTRLPGMESTTPGTVASVSTDPFAELEEAITEEDPFSEHFGENAGQLQDPFADMATGGVSGGSATGGMGIGGAASNADGITDMGFDGSGVAGNTSVDPFAQPGGFGGMDAVVDDFAGFEVEDGGINGEFDEDALFDMLEQDPDGNGFNADPFAGTGASLDNVPSGVDVFGDGDPFAEIDMNAFSEGENGGTGSGTNAGAYTTLDVGDFVGGVGGVMNGSSVAEDVIGDITGSSGTSRASANASAMDAEPFADASFSQDPFADFDGSEADSFDEMQAEGDPYDDGDLFSDGGNYADPFDFDDEYDNGGYDNGYDDGYDDKYDEYDDPRALASGDGAGDTVTYDAIGNPIEHAIPAEMLAKDQVSLSEILDALGNKMSSDDYAKMSSMIEPVWDYSMEQADGIGQKGLFGKKSKGAISGSSEDELASSIYIQDMEEINGYYMPPTDCKVLTVSSFKGGSGKSLANYCILQYIRNGILKWGNIGEIRPGDYVYNRLGQAVEVLQIFPQPEPLDVYRVTLKDGRTIDCSGDHLWNVLQRSGNKAKDHHRRVLTTEELMSQSLVKNAKHGKQEYRWKIPVAHALEYPERALPVDPYLLGLLIGDGHLAHGVHVSTGDREIVDTITEILGENYSIEKTRPNNDKDYDWTIKYHNDQGELISKHSPLCNELARLGLYEKLAEDKFIPDDYLYASIEQRRALLQGLMDSDGTAHRGRVNFTTVNRQLRDQFLQLVRSLGYVCSVSKDNRGWEKYTHTSECWTVSVQSNDVENIFRLERKKQDFYQYQQKQTPRKTLPDRTSVLHYGNETRCEDLPVDPYLFGLIFARKITPEKQALKITCRDNFIVANAINSLPKDVALLPEKEINKRASKSSYMLVDDEHISTASSKNACTITKDLLSSCYPNGQIFLSDRGMILIPDIYLHAEEKARQALLQGIYDALGIFTNGSRCLPSVKIADDAQDAQVRQLVESLGYTTMEPTTKIDQGRIILATNDANVFRSDDLKEEMLNYIAVNYGDSKGAWMSNDNEYISITNIEKLDKKADMTCLLVDDDEHLFVAGDFIVTHNTTVSVGLASQLNWYFNTKLMQRISTNYNARILIFSLNEFDDIPVHGVGYDTAFSQENDTDGKNMAELLRRIDETGGDPQWDDIKHCFVSTDRNRVFYLPSLTTREILTNNISLTAEDYKKIVECCKRFFQFIVIDTPDVFYQQKNDIMNFAYSISDIIVMIIEPDTRSTVNLMHFFDGLKSETGRIPLPPEKCLLVVNKVVKDGNPYITLPPVDQIKFERITTMLSDRYERFVAIPFTQPRGTGNILFGTDRHVKLAFAELADDVLEMIDNNDRREEAKKMARARRH